MLGKCGWLWRVPFLWLVASLGVAQPIRDSFSDGNLTANPAWTGDVADFAIANGQLTHPTGTGTAQLVTPWAVDLTQQDLEWRLWVAHNRASLSGAGTRVRVYLIASQAPTASTVQGYYLEFSDAEGTHALRLFRQVGSSRLLLAQSPAGLLLGPCQVRVRVRRDRAGFWGLSWDPVGGEAFGSEVRNYDAAVQSGLVLGLVLTTNATAAGTWRFDDLYAGPWETTVDLTPPRLQNWTWLPNDSLRLEFSEGLDATRLQPDRYRWSGGGVMVEPASSPGRPNRVALAVTPRPAADLWHELRLTGLADAAGNAMPDTLVRVRWQDVRMPAAGEVVLSEVMADPSPAVGQPEAEYVELHNRTGMAMTLMGLRLRRAGQAAVSLPADTLPAGGYRVYAAAAVAPLLPGGRSLPIPTAWLRNERDTLWLESASGQVLDRMFYSQTDYGNPTKAQGGWSLERVDASYPCWVPGAWVASEAASGGTPGGVNSVAGIVFPPAELQLAQREVPAPTTLVLRWNQSLDSVRAREVSRWQLQAGQGIAVHQVQVGPWPWREVTLRLTAPMDTSQRVVLAVQGLLRCDGSALAAGEFELFREPAPAPRDWPAGAVQVSEVMWDPPTGGARYVELLNRTAEPIPLTGARIVRTTGAPTSSFDSVALTGLVLPPYARVALSDDTLWVRQQYQAPDSARLARLARRLPALESAGGLYRILAPSGAEADRVVVAASQHHSSLQRVEGVALERRSGGWGSAAGPRYGTPGWRNSEGQPGRRLTLAADHLSPNGDGYRDELVLRYDLPGEGTQVRGRIYDRSGYLIAEPLPTQLAVGSGTWLWDGRDRQGRLPSPGLYVWVVEVWQRGQAAEVVRLPFALSLPPQ